MFKGTQWQFEILLAGCKWKNACLTIKAHQSFSWHVNLQIQIETQITNAFIYNFEFMDECRIVKMVVWQTIPLGGLFHSEPYTKP